MSDVDDTFGVDPEVQKQKDLLIAKAKKKVEIDQKEILMTIQDNEDNVDLLDELYSELVNAGVKIINNNKDDDDDDDIILTDDKYLDDISDDSVRLYLR